jgi:hypothetical protein
VSLGPVAHIETQRRCHANNKIFECVHSHETEYDDTLMSQSEMKISASVGSSEGMETGDALYSEKLHRFSSRRRAHQLMVLRAP